MTFRHCAAPRRARSTSLLLGASIAALVALASPAEAATATVDEVVVAGRSIETTLPLELSKTGSDLETVTAETIRDSVYIDVSQALSMRVPGLFVSPANGPFSYVDISLQGSRNGDVLWLVDGVRINNRLYRGTSPADTLPASMVERIEVLKGGQGLFYGTAAAGGVVNVVTRAYANTTGGELNLGADTNGGLHGNGYVRGAIGGHRLVAWASKDKADGYEAFDAYQPSATLRKRSYDVGSVGLKYGYDLTQDLSVNLQYIFTHAELDYPSPRLTAAADNTRDEQILSARADYVPDGPVQLFVKGYWHWWDSHYTTVENSLTSPGTTVLVDDNLYWGYYDYGVNALAKFRIHKGFEYQLGYDLQNFNGRDEVLLIAEKTETVHALIAQVATTEDLFERARFAAGVRQNWADDNTTTVWNVSGHVDLTDAFYVEGLAGTSFILPDAEQLFGHDPCCAAGNPNLDAEESANVNLSIGGAFPDSGISWQATLFASDIKNLIVDDYDDPAFPDGIYINTAGKVRTRGAELSAVAKLGDSFNLAASYAYTRSRNAGSSVQRDRTPEHTAKASLDYDPSDRPYGASVAARWVGDVYGNASGFGRQEFGNYLVVDLAAHVFLDGPGGKHRVTARLENAFDEDYATRVSSALIDNSTQRFLFHTLGVPRTFHLSYGYSF
jgi:vitamin B12 transporter